MTIEQQQQMYDTLKRMTEYMTPADIVICSDDDANPAAYENLITTNYENMQSDAGKAIRGVERPVK